MNTKIKYLDFKGVEKKEQILFKSYLNLAKNELDYQLIVLSKKSHVDDTPDMLIADSGYEFTDSDQEYKALPTILVGNDVAFEQDNYISRPVQWSDFKRALASLSFEEPHTGQEPKRLLPDQMRFAIKEIIEENSISVGDNGESESTDQVEDIELELGSMSVDYHSHTNSEYMKVVEDVQDFNNAVAQEGENASQQVVVLVSDEESASVNSVLVIETDTLDVWDMESFVDDEEQELEQADSASDPEEDVSENEMENARRQAIFKRLEAGETISIDDEYWLDGGEFFCDAEPLFVIRSGEDVVYSAMEPAKWGVSMRNRELIKLPLEADWEPTDDLKDYSISRLPWANSIATNFRSLVDGVEENQSYMLQSWPDFDLLELDNMLLKLCTMLYVGPESPASLMEKTAYSRSVVFAFVNACQTIGILRHEDDIEKSNLAQLNQKDGGMLNKIKDVFR